MDIKAKIEELVGKIKGDSSLLSKFTSDPVKTLEELIGVDLPDEQIEEILKGVKAKVLGDKDGDGTPDFIENIGEKISGIFKK